MMVRLIFKSSTVPAVWHPTAVIPARRACFTRVKCECRDSCSDSDQCNGAETCDAGGVCQAGTQQCNDSNECTEDSCDAVTGCANTPASQGTNCASGVCNGDTVAQRVWSVLVMWIARAARCA